MKPIRRWATVLVTASLLVAACTSQTDDDATTTTGGGDGPAGLAANNSNADSTVGITDDTINVAYIGVDFSSLASTGLVPVLGDQEKSVKAIVDEINADGGMGGREVKLDFQLIDFLNSGDDVLQAACIRATQEFKAALVVLPPAAPRDLARCTAVTNKTLTMYATGMDRGLYTEAEGRLFTIQSDLTRFYTTWAQTMDAEGVLDGKTIGIVNGDSPAEFASSVKDALVPQLEALGHEAKEVITLPCVTSGTSQGCTQYDTAAQRMKDAGVDLVFMDLANTIGPSFVEAADNIDFHPAWLAAGNQTTDTITGFFDSVKDSWDGMVGFGFAFDEERDIPDESRECNATITERSGEKYEEGSDAFGFAADLCVEFGYVDQSADAAGDAALDQGTLISGVEDLGDVVVPAGDGGSLSKVKHDALNYAYLCDYTAAAGKCTRRAGDSIKLAD